MRSQMYSCTGRAKKKDGNDTNKLNEFEKKMGIRTADFDFTNFALGTIDMGLYATRLLAVLIKIEVDDKISRKVFELPTIVAFLLRSFIEEDRIDGSTYAAVVYHC